MSEQTDTTVSAPDDYLDDDAEVVDPGELAWWRHHKQQGHHLSWEWGAVPVCYTCGKIYGMTSSVETKTGGKT